MGPRSRRWRPVRARCGANEGAGQGIGHHPDHGHLTGQRRRQRDRGQLRGQGHRNGLGEPGGSPACHDSGKRFRSQADAETGRRGERESPGTRQPGIQGEQDEDRDAQIADAAPAAPDSCGGQDDRSVRKRLSLNSRLIGTGDLFVPLKGARDGHDFIETAFENGAVVTLSEKEVANHPYILVDDVLTAFQTLAAYYLEKTAVDVFAVTGSNGKTTTKDMLAHLLSTTYKTYKTQGNYNNEIGLPYTVLHMPEETEKLVLEMGQDHLGDIHLLSELAHPKTAIVTLVGEAHLAFFKDRSEIAKGKMQIADGMAPGSLLLAPADPIVEDYLPTDKKVVPFWARS